jgi:hypothetical protein
VLAGHGSHRTFSVCFMAVKPGSGIQYLLNREQNILKYPVILLLFLISLLCLTLPVSGQQMLGMSYNMAFPQGDMKIKAGSDSYIGFGIEGRQFFHPDLTFGVSFNWNKFNTTVPRIGTPGTDERNIDTFPLLLNLHYYLFEEASTVRPLFGLNAGTYFINDRLFTSTGLRQQKHWHFGFAPEIGLYTRIMSDLHLLILLRYNYALESGGAGGYEYWGLHFTFVSVSIL